MSVLPQHGFADTRTVARHIAMAPSWVRAHAHELGGHRFGTSLRFDVTAVRSWLEQRRILADQPARRRKPGPKTGVGGAIPADIRDWA